MNHKIKLFWSAVDGADSYNIYYTEDGTEPGTGNGTKIEGITNTGYEVSGLSNFTVSRFVVTSVKFNLESSKSNSIRLIPPGNIISAGHNHTVALKSDETVWTWGDNRYGQLGDNSTIDKKTPVTSGFVLYY